jgi:hypothetical protein
VRILLAVHLKRNPTQELIYFLTEVSSTPTYVSGMSIEKIDKHTLVAFIYTCGSTPRELSQDHPEETVPHTIHQILRFSLDVRAGNTMFRNFATVFRKVVLF